MDQTFIFASADAHDQKFLRMADKIVSEHREVNPEKRPAIRRPHRGIQIKKDIYATLSVYRANGEPIKLWSESAFDSDDEKGHGKVTQYGDFILQRISDERAEKQQIVETFGESFIFFFGERPRIVSFTGVLVNSDDFNWRGQFWKNYEEHLRGTRLVEQNARAYLAYDSIVLEGYPVQATASEVSETPYLVQFQMTMFLTNYTDYSDIGVRMFPGDTTVPNVDVLNRELELGTGPEGDFVGITTAGAVRLKNFMYGRRGKTVSSVLSELNRAATNNKVTSFIENMVGGVFSDVNLLLTGRAVTVPVGRSGFFEQIGTATMAPGSILPFFALEGENVGSIRVLIPSAPRFGGVSKDLFRTVKSKNLDEYPYLDGQEVQVDPLMAIQARERALSRKMLKGDNDRRFLLMNLADQAEHTKMETIASIARFTKAAARSAFVMAVMAKRFGTEGASSVLATAFGVGEFAPGVPSAGRPVIEE